MSAKTKISPALAALALVTALATSGAAQARPQFGVGIGLAAGTLIGAAAASNATGGPAYLADHGYDECRFVERTDRRGNVRIIKICEVVPY